MPPVPPVTIDVDLQVVNGIIKKTVGGVELPVVIRLRTGDHLNFHYPEPFAFFLTSFQRTSIRRGRKQFGAMTPNFPSPFAPPGRVHSTDSGVLRLTVIPGAVTGYYTYALALDDGNGGIATQDPQIIIE